ncbi:MAG: DUF4426 domain-containing protein [Lysobacteraceae bacterium]
MRSLFTLLILALATAPALAQSVRSGEYTLYYSTMPSTQLTPEVARATGTTRSASRALLNVAVRRDSEDGLGAPVEADIRVTARNAVGQLQTPQLRAFREDGAIYYLGQLRHAEGETLDIEIEARVEGHPRPIRVRLRQDFHGGP